MTLLKILLIPVSLLYGFIIWMRNKLYDLKIFSSRSFDIPVISVGNLTLGGTGKTPTIEYIVRLLKKEFSIAILSRGYKRNTKGFLLAEEYHSAIEIGDEPRQYKQKFKDVLVAVDENRCRGIDMLLQLPKKPDVILLDDAFQHRAVRPGLSILLTDYHNTFFDNFMFPTGSLRESRIGAKRADIIVVTKTPKIFSPIVRKKIIEDLKPRSNQQVYFSFIKFLSFHPMIISNEKKSFEKKINTILMVTGIANPYPLKEHLTKHCFEINQMNFPDHHHYSNEDIQKILQNFNNIASRNKIIVTTEKDIMRFEKAELTGLIKDLPIYYVPIEFDFHHDSKENFNHQILNYVRQNKKNS